MTNSSLVSYTQISPNRTKNRNHAIDTITIHCTAGQCSVQTLGRIFSPTSRQASSNYGVGYDGAIGMYCEEKDRSWCSSSATNDHRAITIEVASDDREPYAVNAKAYSALLDLVTDICKRNGIKKLVWSTNKTDRVNHRNGCNMTVHRDYANKSCPGTYLYNRQEAIVAEVNRRLSAANTPTTPTTPKEDDNMDLNAFRTLYNQMRSEWNDNDAGNYSTEARAWAVKTGLIEGNGKTTATGEPNYMWQDMLTREQFVTVLYRFAKSVGMV